MATALLSSRAAHVHPACDAQPALLRAALQRRERSLNKLGLIAGMDVGQNAHLLPCG
jgi:hypothetical protein